jgi:hypothetical protein
MPGKNTGLKVEKWHKSWFLRHTVSGLPAGPHLRLKRHATQMMNELLATGADFTLPTGEQVRNSGGRRLRQVVTRWRRRAEACCEGGDHYNPYSWRDERGRCHR